MRTILTTATMLLTTLVVLADGPMPPQAPPLPVPTQAPPMAPWGSPVAYPEGMERFEPATVTQSISVLVGHGDQILRAPIKGLASKWHQSGGMEGVRGVTSDKYRLLPEKPKEYIANIAVWNGSNFQDNRGLKRDYASGTRFDDVLSYRGQVFEHRTRHKQDNDTWVSRVLWSDKDARPEGYTGLKVTCASCHDDAGSGGYATGLVPGGDTVLSDPLPWHLVTRRQQYFEEPQPSVQGFIPQFQPSYGSPAFRGRGRRGR